MSCVARALPANSTLMIAVADQLADVFDAAGVDDGRAEHGQDLLAGRAGLAHGRGDLADASRPWASRSTPGWP